MHTYSYSQIWKIAFPVLISTLMEQLIGMTDTAFLGRIGEVELGASALGGIFFVTIFMLGLGFSIGAQILMGRRNGEGNYLQIGNIFYHSLQGRRIKLNYPSTACLSSPHSIPLSVVLD